MVTPNCALMMLHRRHKSVPPLALQAAQRLTKGRAILGRHDIVNNGVNGGGNVVANTAQVEKVLIGGPVPSRVDKINVA